MITFLQIPPDLHTSGWFLSVLMHHYQLLKIRHISSPLERWWNQGKQCYVVDTKWGGNCSFLLCRPALASRPGKRKDLPQLRSRCRDRQWRDTRGLSRVTLWQGNGDLHHAPAHEMVLADGSLRRGVKNGSEGHCLGTLEKKGFAARRARWQAAPQWQQEKSTGYVFLLVGVVAEPKLRVPAKGRVQLLPRCCLGRVGNTPSLLSPRSTRAVSVAFLAHGGGLPDTHGIAQLRSPVSARSYQQNCLTGAAGLSGSRMSCPGKNAALLVNI